MARLSKMALRPRSSQVAHPATALVVTYVRATAQINMWEADRLPPFHKWRLSRRQRATSSCLPILAPHIHWPILVGGNLIKPLGLPPPAERGTEPNNDAMPNPALQASPQRLDQGECDRALRLPAHIPRLFAVQALYVDMPEFWFIQLEMQFQVNNVTVSLLRYHQRSGRCSKKFTPNASGHPSVSIFTRTCGQP